jgi:hypothetical protein
MKSAALDFLGQGASVGPDWRGSQMRVLTLLALLVALLVAGCGVLVPPLASRDPDEVLHVENRGGPDLVLVVGSARIVVPCGATLSLMPGDGGLPGLPWTLEVRVASSGEVVLVEQVTELPRYFLQIDNDPPGLSDTVALGPSVTCPPSP